MEHANDGDHDARTSLAQYRMHASEIMPRSRPTSPAYASTGSSTSPQNFLQAAPSIISVSSWIFGEPSTSPVHQFQPSNVLLTSADHNVIHSTVSPTSKFPNFGQDDLEEPELQYTRGLLGILLLTTSLAWCSAIDARFQCSSQEADDIYDLWDDDAVIYSQLERVQETKLCLEMFRWVMIPVGVVTGVLSLISLYLMRPQVLYRIKEKTWTKLERRKGCYHLCLRLLFTFPLVLVAWTYGIVIIMLQPRTDYLYHSDTNNLYHSLAAVDYMGHVGDNANLYYLSWISLGLSLGIVYQIAIDTVRQYRRYRQARSAESDLLAKGDDIEAMMLSYTTKRQLEHYHETRATWYSSLYRLRIRSGIWVAAFLSSLVITASSLHVWFDVLVPTAQGLSKSVDSFRKVCPTITKYRYGSPLPLQLCSRTEVSIVAGFLAALLCLGAIVLHMQVRQNAAHVVEEQQENSHHHCAPALSVEQYTFVHHLSNKTSLRAEFALSAVLLVILGLNAVFVTGVQGPASTVGNLYYASWIAFLLCLRICLGCLEELYNIEMEQHENEEEGMEMTLREHQKEESSYVAPSLSVDARGSSDSTRSRRVVKRQSSLVNADLFDNHRAQRLRRFLLLAIFSLVCTASALDAALNHEKALTWDQRYVIIAPSVVAVLCVIQFAMCLRTYTYAIIANVCAGFFLSMITFLLWLVGLVITMHSDNSWAVNAVGDIKAANLYYFSWASILTAGLHMSSYISLLLGLKKKGYITFAWLAICKVCFVIMGASVHIWFGIKETCTLEDVKSGSFTFCSRTVFAIVVSLTGMLVGACVVITRILIAWCCPGFSTRIRAHVEMIVSAFLVLLFGVAAAVITGIGGPGQSVGDLYYSTWIAFMVALGVGTACFREIVKEDTECEWMAEDSSAIEKDAHFVQMQ